MGIAVCNQPGGLGLEMQILPRTRKKAEFWTKFRFLTRACQDFYRLQCQVVKYCFISTSNNDGTKKSHTIGGIFPAWWDLSRTMFSMTFLISWVKTTFLWWDLVHLAHSQQAAKCPIRHAKASPNCSCDFFVVTKQNKNTHAVRSYNGHGRRKRSIKDPATECT